MKKQLILVMAAWGLASCASHQPPEVISEAAASPSPVAAPRPLLPRSSVAAVIQHRGELALSDDQINQLELLDQRRESEDDAVRKAAEQGNKPAQSGTSGGAAAGGGSGAQNAGQNAGRRAEMGMGGGRGGRMPRASASAPKEKDHHPPIQDRLDANDTKAYLDAEELLTNEQRDRAREIASDYRAALYDQRENAAHDSQSQK